MNSCNFTISMNQRGLFNSVIEYISLNSKLEDDNNYYCHKTYEFYDSHEVNKIIMINKHGNVEFDEKIINYEYKVSDEIYSSENDNGGLDRYKEIILTVNNIDDNRNLFENFTKHVLDTKNKTNFRMRNSKEKQIKLYEYDSIWYNDNTMNVKSIDSVILPENIKNNTIEAINNFDKNYETYKNLGIPYCMIFMFYGLPGTGKTSFIHALASHFNKDLCMLSFKADMTDLDFKKAFLKLPSNSFLIIEDLDCLFNKRNVDTKTFVTFSGLLNTLDGLLDSKNKIVFITTNHIENIDNAIKRRIHHFIKFDYANNIQKEQMIRLMLPNISDECIDYFKKQSGKTTTNIIQKFLLKLVLHNNITISMLSEFKEFNEDYLKNSFNNIYT